MNVPGPSAVLQLLTACSVFVYCKRPKAEEQRNMKKEALRKIRATTDAAAELFQGGIYVPSPGKLCGMCCIANISNVYMHNKNRRFIQIHGAAVRVERRSSHISVLH